MTDDLKLTVRFRNVALPNDAHAGLPEDVFARLNQSTADLIAQHFKSVSGAQKGFDAHKKSPYPNDDVQQVMAKIDEFVRKTLINDFGPTTVKNLLPAVAFE